MKTKDLLSLSINNLFHRKIRSWLTIIGIIIGVASVVALVSIGQGVQASVQNQLNVLGGNLVIVTPGSSRATGFSAFAGTGGERAGNLTTNDLKIIQSIPGVQSVDGIVSQRATIRYVNENSSISVQGVNPSVYQYFTTATLFAGRFISQGDTFSAVLGYNPANTLFTRSLTVNSIIQINGLNFRVVGILQQSGNTQLDNVVVIPVASARRIFTSIPSDQFSEILLKTTSNDNVAQVASDIQSRLLVSHHETLTNKDFTVTTAQSISQTISQVTGTITLFLGSIAAISLIVGGVGIANTMFMSVLERTRQIGIMKALGATSNDVLKLFIIESALIGLVGGTIGVVFGATASQVISIIGGGTSNGGLRGGGFGFGGGGAGLVTVVTPQIVLIAIGFSVVIGILSGVLPARQAAKLDPVQALSYE